MITNMIYVATRGTDPKKYETIPGFENVTGKEKYKLMYSGFRMAGKVAEFARTHKIAEVRDDYNWNGYGYADHDYKMLFSLKDAKELISMIETRKATRKVQTQEQINASWARRLSKLTGISVKKALRIAQEKLDDQQKRIDKLEDRQCERHSIKREKLINQLRRENPLRRIEDEVHAHRILEASVRHNCSDYEYKLEEARDMAAWGLIDWRSVKGYAREHTTYSETVESAFKNEDVEDIEDDEENEDVDDIEDDEGRDDQK